MACPGHNRAEGVARHLRQDVHGAQRNDPFLAGGTPRVTFSPTDSRPFRAELIVSLAHVDNWRAQRRMVLTCPPEGPRSAAESGTRVGADDMRENRRPSTPTTLVMNEERPGGRALQTSVAGSLDGSVNPIRSNFASFSAVERVSGTGTGLANPSSVRRGTR